MRHGQEVSPQVPRLGPAAAVQAVPGLVALGQVALGQVDLDAIGTRVHRAALVPVTLALAGLLLAGLHSGGLTLRDARIAVPKRPSEKAMRQKDTG